MALSKVNIGTSPNDDTGDTIRESFTKVNLAIDEIETKMPALDTVNPTLTMHVGATGSAAQMDVVDSETGHLVASMEWYKPDQDFTFNLFDRTTGAMKAEFVMKPDGNGYIGGEQIQTTPDRASMRLNQPVNVDANDTTYVIFPLDEIVTQKGCTANASTHKILIKDTGDYTIARGVIAGFSGQEEMALMVFVNDIPYSGYPLTVQGKANNKPVSIFWADEVSLSAGDIVDIRVRNFDAGNVTFHVKRATLQVRKIA
jgi:hypothetical protein